MSASNRLQTPGPGAWRAGLAALALLFASPSLAGQLGRDAQFSPKGVYAAGYRRDTPKIYVFNYANWPASAVEMTTITTAKPLVEEAVRRWRLLDDGSVWIAEGTQLIRYVGGGRLPTSVDLGPRLPAGATLQAVVMGYGAIPSVIYVLIQQRQVVEVRCPLDIALMEADAGASLCKTKSVMALDLPNYTNDGDPFTKLIVTADDYSDYHLRATFALRFQLVPAGAVTKTAYIRNGEKIVESFDSYKDTYEQAIAPDTGKLLFPANLMVESQDNDKTILRYGNISKPGGYYTTHIKGYAMIVTYDGYYAFTRTLSNPSGSYLVRDLRKVAGFEHEVLMSPPGFDLMVSPDNRFFINDAFDKPLPMAYMTDPYYGKSKDIIEDILMSRIIKALGEQRWSDALPVFTELESRVSLLPEDFYFYQADTLARAGQRAEAQKKAELFIAKYGRKSPHHDRMIEILAQ